MNETREFVKSYVSNDLKKIGYIGKQQDGKIYFSNFYPYEIELTTDNYDEYFDTKNMIKIIQKEDLDYIRNQWGFYAKSDTIYVEESNFEDFKNRGQKEPETLPELHYIDSNLFKDNIDFDFLQKGECIKIEDYLKED